MKKEIAAAFCLVILIGGQALAQRMAVTSTIANVRSGPGTQYGINWKIEKFHPLYVFEKSGNWYHFRDFEKDEGWIHKSLLDDIETVITTREVNNIRMGPGTKYDVLFSVEKGVPFKVITKKGKWINVQHADGDKGWIYKTLVW